MCQIYFTIIKTIINMFGLFKKKKSELEQLQEKYAALLKEAYALSHSNRKASDMKTAEAEEVAKQIDLLKAQTSL